MPNCRTCPHGPYSNESDICDHCRNEPDIGWGGFTDGKYGRHFYTEAERDANMQIETIERRTIFDDC